MWLRHNQSLSIAARAKKLNRSTDSVKQILRFLGIQRNGYLRARTAAQRQRKAEIFEAANAAGLGLHPIKDRVNTWIESGAGSVEGLLKVAAVQACNKWSPEAAAAMSPVKRIEQEPTPSIFDDKPNRYAVLREFVAPNGKAVKVIPSPAQAARGHQPYAR